MPEVVRPNMTVTYSVLEIESMVRQQTEYLYPADTVKKIEPIFEGGHKTCDCDSWGGPTIGSCRCATTPVRFKGYKVTCEGSR